ncbi:MAG: hypothetical protein QOG63_933 [Thermoleophilaceae bacterium]|jgi:hypothetical protein|nr:hypothetical protein [Thermoleophilaceae bacterium]
MGLFKKMRNMTGSVSKKLLEEGLLGRGIITDITQTGVSTGSDFNPAHVCVFTVEVSLDNTPRYNATCRQAVLATVLPQLAAGGTTVAVRVNPEDHSEIALSLGEQPPTVTMAASGDKNTGSAAEILAYGEDCKAVIVEFQPLGTKNPKGDDMYAFRFTVLVDGLAPYQVTVGNPVPANAVPLVYPGNTVPAKRMPSKGEKYIVVDWAAALEQVEHATH